MIEVNIKDKTVLGKRNLERISLLQDIRFELIPGELVLLAGSSGAGKSTLVKSIMGTTSYKGNVSFRGADGTTKPSMAYIEQTPSLNVDETVYEALWYAAKMSRPSCTEEQIGQQVKAVLTKLGISKKKNSYIKTLSGGQQKRVAIGRELVRNADFYLLDEPDSGLDMGTSMSFIIEGIGNYIHTENKYALYISHYLNNYDLFDKIIILSKDEEHVGRIAYWGTPKHFKEYFNCCGEVRDIMEMINPKTELGKGLGQKYIDKYRYMSLSEREYYLGKKEAASTRIIPIADCRKILKPKVIGTSGTVAKPRVLHSGLTEGEAL